jgi:hypothetical protein
VSVIVSFRLAAKGSFPEFSGASGLPSLASILIITVKSHYMTVYIIGMAKLTDLPAEPVHRIIHYLYYPDPQPLPHGCKRSKPRDEHHLLDHTEINSSLKPLPRPHEERYIDRGPNYPMPYSDKVTWPGGR